MNYNKDETKISVIITTRNRRYEAARALRSVFAQTVAADEIIIVDDGSVDGTREYIASLYLGTYQYFYNTTAKGTGSSRNTGIRAAKGDLIAFLDSDNEWDSRKLERFRQAAAADQNADLFCSRYRQHREFSTVILPEPVSGRTLTVREELSLHNPAEASATMYRREFLEKLHGFSETDGIDLDRDLLRRAVEMMDVNIHKIDDVLSENWVMYDCLSERGGRYLQEWEKLPRTGQSVAEMEKKNYALGFTAGAFDLFHIGHLNLLRRCGEQCDRLMVGVMTDEFIEHQKGRKPFVPLAERMEIVQSVRYVDEVVPVDFHNTVKPDAWTLYHFDVCFSGDDHAHEEGFQREQRRLRELGSDMVFFPYTKQTCSTKIKSLIDQKLV
ncbi:glycosyltransferase [Lachnospiraceae bacterium JLR.KK008]